MPNLIQFSNNDIVNDTQKVAVSTWTNNQNNLTTVFTSSIQADVSSATSSGAFILDVYNSETGSAGSEVQFSIAYGHRAGSSSLNFTNDVGGKGRSSSGVTYAQYRNLVFGDNTISDFKFNDHTPDDIWIININRARYKHNLKTSTLNLYLSGSGVEDSGPTINNPGLYGQVHLTDDSITTTGSSTITNVGRQFNIVSGANGEQSGSNLTQIVDAQTGDSIGSYGLFYPDAGFIILNGDAVSQSIGLSASRADHVEPEYNKLFNAIRNGNGGLVSYFIVDSEEKISSQFYFVRARNGEFNYTTNPSYIDDSGNLNFVSMIDNPKTFITTVGLYNNNGDLVAVAKISQPIAKDFTKEALIRVKLDY